MPREASRAAWGIIVWLAIGMGVITAEPFLTTNATWQPPLLNGPNGWNVAVRPEDAYQPFSSSSDANEQPPDERDGDSSGVAERLEKLEKKYASLVKEQDAIKSTQKKSALRGFEDVTVQVGGRIHLDYWAFPGDSPGVNAFETGDPLETPQDRLEIRRARIELRGEILNAMLYKFDVEFSETRDPEIRDLYLGWRELPVLQTLLIGNQKRPYSLDHLNSSNNNVFLERPFVIDAFNNNNRRFGIASRGYSRNEAWNWQYGVFNLKQIQNNAEYISDHYQMEVSGRLAHTGWYDESNAGRNYTHCAIAGSFAHPDGSADLFREREFNQAIFETRPEARSSSEWLDTEEIVGARYFGLLATEGVINIGPCQLVGEYQSLWLNRDPGFPGPLHFHGGYLYLSYFLTGEHMPWNRRLGIIGRVRPHRNFFLADRRRNGAVTGWGAWQIAVRGSYADLTDGNVEGGVGESVTFGLNWYWNSYARMQFNYLYGNIDQHFPIAGQTFGDYQILGTRFMIVF